MQMNRRYVLIALLLILPLLLQAADRKDKHLRDTLKYPDTYLDTVQVNKVFTLNKYNFFFILSPSKVYHNLKVISIILTIIPR